MCDPDSFLARAQTAKLGSLVDVQNSDDPDGLKVLYYLVQDLKVSVKAPPFGWRSPIPGCA